MPQLEVLRPRPDFEGGLPASFFFGAFLWRAIEPSELDGRRHHVGVGAGGEAGDCRHATVDGQCLRVALAIAGAGSDDRASVTAAGAPDRRAPGVGVEVVIDRLWSDAVEVKPARIE